ncbi:aldehyde dehydrogenase [Phenylobacterium aquaticum]|uniref:aldehyde dehydrogenase n=1 Tax=Phenylobacterium aquaticum TaxID=1763816 RepID=UPI0026F080CE|nr:aldehyde dehydrogenase [Phenylobacterium aquaticum]
MSVQSPAQAPAQIGSFINGAPRAPRAGGFDIPVIDPASEAVISQLREADAEEVGLAVSAARTAFDDGRWSKLTHDRRKAVLYDISRTLSAHAAELADLEVQHTGLPITGVRHHIARAAANFEMFADVASLQAGQTYTQTDNYLTYVTREPKGVGALIAPWNAPLALASMRVATCIAFGNTCVLKPSEFTPVSMLRMVELFHEAGLPDGVVNLVNGRGAVTGVSLVSNPDIDMVSFVGGTGTGRAIASAAGQNLKPCILELGGKSASLVFESADLDQALDGTLLGIYANNGQQCLAGSRILLQRSIADAFIEKFVARTRNIRIGDPRAETTEIGPLAYRAHMERVLGFVDVAKADGATLLTGGKKAAGFDKGFYMEPTAVLAPSNRSKVAQEEIFGPFATFIIFDTLDEAIAIANDSPFGLVSYVWSNDLPTTMRCSRDIRAGVIWVNTPMMRELRAPFGGYKESGFGRDGATTSAEFFTEAKTTSIPIVPLKLPGLGRGA